MDAMPHLEERCGKKMLIADGKPFLIRGGELHNSSASSLAYMEERVWPVLRGMHLNTVVLPVTWELTEPEEGVFDFSLADGLLAQARREGMKLVLLWFGLWKNAQSAYVPSWVQTDPERFFRVRNEFGMPLKHVSPLCGEAVEADAAAFSALMRHLRETDGEERTVLLVQVENEIGVLGASRDFSPRAQEEFQAAVPAGVSAEFGRSGSWEEVFGEEAEEQFMAWHYGRAVERIASAGKREYPLPLYVNAWLEQFPAVPGAYPSGGPVWKMHRIWKLAAPSIDFFSPDIYVDDYRAVCDEYAAEGNPLFIPEVRNTVDAVPFLFYAVGRHGALGFSPFGVEDMGAGAQAQDAAVLETLNIGASALSAGGSAGKLLTEAYRILEGMEPLLFRAQEKGAVQGFLEAGEGGVILSLRDCDLKITYNGHGSFFAPDPGKEEGAPLGGGFLIEEEDCVYLTGVGFTAEFLPKKGRRELIEILRKEEGRFENGAWIPGRVLNGDEGYFIRFGNTPETQKISIYQIGV